MNECLGIAALYPHQFASIDDSECTVSSSAKITQDMPAWARPKDQGASAIALKGL